MGIRNFFAGFRNGSNTAIQVDLVEERSDLNNNGNCSSVVKKEELSSAERNLVSKQRHINEFNKEFQDYPELLKLFLNLFDQLENLTPNHFLDYRTEDLIMTCLFNLSDDFHFSDTYRAGLIYDYSAGQLRIEVIDDIIQTLSSLHELALVHPKSSLDKQSWGVLEIYKEIQQTVKNFSNKFEC